MITLLANGCSHTAGTYIEPHRIKCYELAWPKLLADDMGWNCINLAESANSNEQIKRTTVEWLIENVELTNRYNPEDLVVMIMWSGFSRFEIWNGDCSRLISTSGLFVEHFSFEEKEYIKHRVIISRQDVINYKNLMDVYLTTKYLESLNIKYYFINALESWPMFSEDNNADGMLEITKKYKLLYEAYGHRCKRHLGFSSYFETFWYYMNDHKIPFSKHDPDKFHFGVEGQKFWKENVKAWMARIHS